MQAACTKAMWVLMTWTSVLSTHLILCHANLCPLFLNCTFPLQCVVRMVTSGDSWEMIYFGLIHLAFFPLWRLSSQEFQPPLLRKPPATWSGILQSSGFLGPWDMSLSYLMIWIKAFHAFRFQILFSPPCLTRAHYLSACTSVHWIGVQSLNNSHEMEPTNSTLI